MIELERKLLLVGLSFMIILGFSINASAQTSDIIPLDNRNHHGQISTPSNMIPAKSQGPVHVSKDHASVSITLGCGPKDIHYGSYLNTCYQPTVLVVKPGTTVTWRNDDTTIHSVTDGNVWVVYSISYFFDSVTLEPGQTFSYQYNYPGAYPYFDTFNPWETGVVIVEK